MRAKMINYQDFHNTAPTRPETDGCVVFCKKFRRLSCIMFFLDNLLSDG